jgi:hypothetical protein
MQAAPCHDVGFAPKDARRSLLHIDQLIKPDRTKWVIEKKINIGIFARIVARGRAEQEQPLDAEPLQLSFVLPQSGYGDVALHAVMIAQQPLKIEPVPADAMRGV